MASGRFFQEVELPEQKTYDDGVLFPVVLTPKLKTNEKLELRVFVEAIRNEKPWLESLVRERGVILFRGFPVMSPSDFNDVVEAFEYPELLYMGGIAPRTQVVGRVYTANELPLDKQIPFHHEMAYVKEFPSKLFFFCEEEPGPGCGGETPILLSHIVYEKMKEKHPKFVAQLEDHGVTYTMVKGDEGRGWKSLYMTDDKKVAEERAAKLGTKLEWIENGVKSITGPLPAIRFDKESNRKSWFNNLQSAQVNGDGRVYDIDLGNGVTAPSDAMIDCVRILEEECVAIPWKKGDVMLVNNLTVLHSRRPLLKPPRRILASLCKQTKIFKQINQYYKHNPNDNRKILSRSTTEQKSHGAGLVFPVVLTPNTNTNITTCDFKDAIKAEKPWLESLVQKNGAILFRGFPVITPSDFNDVLEAFDFPEAFYVGGRARRIKVVGRVYTANESAPELAIPFHHEMAYHPEYPSKLFFFCEEEPGKGGATAIVLSHIIYEKMKEKHPEFIARLEEHGVTYIKVLRDEDDPLSITGRGWKSTYLTDDKTDAEKRAAKLGTKLEWTENGVKEINGPVPAFRFDKGSQNTTWFNNLSISNIGPMDSNIHDHATHAEFGNGELLPEDAMKDCLKILEEECVPIPWKKGDVMIVNNLTALHGRQPLLKPPRRILVSLTK